MSVPVCVCARRGLFGRTDRWPNLAACSSTKRGMGIQLRGRAEIRRSKHALVCGDAAPATAPPSRLPLRGPPRCRWAFSVHVCRFVAGVTAFLERVATFALHLTRGTTRFITSNNRIVLIHIVKDEAHLDVARSAPHCAPIPRPLTLPLASTQRRTGEAICLGPTHWSRCELHAEGGPTYSWLHHLFAYGHLC